MQGTMNEKERLIAELAIKESQHKEMLPSDTVDYFKRLFNIKKLYGCKTTETVENDDRLLQINTKCEKSRYTKRR